MAVNNYRQSGGGNFPDIKTAPVVYNRQVEIREAGAGPVGAPR